MTPAERTAGLRWGSAASRRQRAQPPSAGPADLAAKAAVLRRLELEVTRRLDGMLSGDHLAFVAGPGTEPAAARQYDAGDDARRIDWNLTARMLSPQVRTTEADRELETWIIADRSASLDFGTAQREKREVVLAAVAAFGFLTVRSGNRLGVLVAGGEELIRLPARSGRIGVLAALSALYDTHRHTAGPSPEADLTAAVARLERTQPRRGQVVVVSDFLDPSDWGARLRRLTMRHQVIAAHVTDPREMSLPPVGILTVVDAESGQHLHVQTNSNRLRQRYSAAADERQQRIRNTIGQTGAEYLSLSTDRDWLLDVVRFIGRRRRERVPSRVAGRAVLAAGAPGSARGVPPTGGGGW